MFFQYPVDDHITLELQSPFHADELFDLVNENRAFIGEHLAWVNRVERHRDIYRYIRRDLMSMAEERRWAWLIRYNGKAIGRIGLFVTMPQLQECELYYFLSKKYTGKGIITKCAHTITNFAINILHLKHVLIGFSPQNPKSGAVAERLGFTYEYTMQDAEKHAHEWRSLHFWGMLADDWESTQKPIFAHHLTDQLYLQLYQPYQSPEKFKLIKANQTEFSQWFWWANDQFTLASERAIARKLLKRYMKQTALGVTIWQNDAMIGNASMTIDLKNKSGSIGYWLDAIARGNGMMTHTIQAMLTSAFGVFGVERMAILVASNNQASRALAERLGMRIELIQKDETLIHGKFVDHVQYAILRDEWKETAL